MIGRFLAALGLATPASEGQDTDGDIHNSGGKPQSGLSNRTGSATGPSDSGSQESPTGSDEQPDTADISVTYDPSSSELPTPEAIHSALVGPSGIETTPRSVQLGDTWARSRWVAEYPETPTDGFLERLYASPATRDSDIAIHIDPRETAGTLDALENHIEELEADVEYLSERRRASARGLQKDLTDYQDLYDALRNSSTKAFDVSTYLTSHAETESDLTNSGLRKTARQPPANLTPVTPRWQQLETLISGSPMGLNKLDHSLSTRTPMLAGAVGAMFPFVSGAFAEPGIEYGTYALNESPMILDRFNRETGYCTMVIGQLGAGKSFSTKLQLVRRRMYDPDTIIIMLDPLQGFAGVNDALDGERITVGGTRGLNPLEIQPTPPEILDSVPDLDPWAEQLSRTMTFFETFFEVVATNPLADRKQTLRRGLQEAYDRKGITRDPATHSRSSPTVDDVISVLESLLAEPASFGYATEGEQATVRDDAQALLKDLRPSFREGGDLANLARETEFDLDSPAVYLDLHQEEGARGRGETSLMMQVLFNAVYERAKQTDKKVVFAIDEAHYLMNDATSLSFLETAVRHSRHYDLSLHFITQTGGEFALTPETRTIASLCSMTVIHRVNEEAEKLAEWFDLSEREVNWVRTAKAGNEEDGYSEALLGIDEEGWFPLRVRASEYEVSAIDGRE